MSDKQVMDYYRVEFPTEWKMMEMSGVYMTPQAIRERIGIPKLSTRDKIKKIFGR